MLEKKPYILAEEMECYYIKLFTVLGDLS